MSIEVDLPHSVIEQPGDEDLGTVPVTEFEGVSYPSNSKPGQNDQSDTPEPARGPQADTNQAAAEREESWTSWLGHAAGKYD